MKLKKFGKKLTATLLSAAMVFTMGTTAAFAAPGSQQPPQQHRCQESDLKEYDPSAEYCSDRSSTYVQCSICKEVYIKRWD